MLTFSVACLLAIQGREILQSTVDLVQNALNLEVICSTLHLEVLEFGILVIFI